MSTTVSLSVSGEYPVEVGVSDKAGTQIVNPGQTWNFNLESDHELHLTVVSGVIEEPGPVEPVEEE